MDVFLKRAISEDERRSADVLAAFDARGTVRLLGCSAEGLLLERLDPAVPLSTVVARDDRAASTVLTEVISALPLCHVPPGTPTVAEWASSFDRYLASGDDEIPHGLVRRAQETYLGLCRSQRQVRLLHGDLHHGNVLFDGKRGWVAVDPKGVVGETEYEVGAALRNPIEMPEVFTDPAVIEARLCCFCETLNLDRSRVTAWAFAQAVLAVIWLIEDGEPVSAEHPWIELALHLSARR